MTKLNIDNLVIEITRRCNLSCLHCLRGNPENIDIKTGVTWDFLEKNDIGYISSVTFTGGEPTLNIDAINDFIDTCTSLSVEVGNFYIAINGTNVPDNFITTVARLYAFCDDNEISQVQVSESDFYYEQDAEQIKKLELFKIFSRKPTADNHHLIREGRAIEWSDDYVNGEGRTINIDSENAELVEDFKDFNDCRMVQGTLYLNVHGDILGCCDLSYESQKQHKLGNVETDSLISILENLDKKYNQEV